MPSHKQCTFDSYSVVSLNFLCNVPAYIEYVLWTHARRRKRKRNLSNIRFRAKAFAPSFSVSQCSLILFLMQNAVSQSILLIRTVLLV